MIVYACALLIWFSVFVLEYYVIWAYSVRQKRKRVSTKKIDIPETGISKSAIRSQLQSLMRGWIRYKLRRLGQFPSHHIRMFILRHIYQMSIGKNVVIYGGFEIRSPWNIQIGDGTIIGDECKLDGRKGIKIGKNVNLSTGVWIWTEQHDVNDLYFRCNSKVGSVIIGDRVWLSARTVILPNIEISEGAVIAAGCVVTKDCDSFTIYGGVPGKRIGHRNEKVCYEFDGSFTPFF